MSQVLRITRNKSYSRVLYYYAETLYSIECLIHHTLHFPQTSQSYLLIYSNDIRIIYVNISPPPPIFIWIYDKYKFICKIKISYSIFSVWKHTNINIVSHPKVVGKEYRDRTKSLYLLFERANANEIFWFSQIFYRMYPLER